MSAAALVLDAVVERILHKRLERQLDDLIFIELLRNRNLIFQYVPVAELLDLSGAADVLLLLLYRDELPPLA